MTKLRSRNRLSYPMTILAFPLLVLLLALVPADSGIPEENERTCGGGNKGDGLCPDASLCCSEWGYCGTGEDYCDYRTCGGGIVGNRRCPLGPIPTCCSPWGWCSAEACGDTISPAPTNPLPPTKPPPPTALPRIDNDRIVGYLGNWQSCPHKSIVSAYTHIFIAFANSYTWSPKGNDCSPSCEIATPPVCNNLPNPELIDAWHSNGKKVILSFGGAGMGGSRDGDVNDCWKYCFGREKQVVTRLTEIVNDMNLDGVNIDYEYFSEDGQNGSNFALGKKAQLFLYKVTVGLRRQLHNGNEISHTPMDSDVQPGKGYYDILVSLGQEGYLDYLMPQYYNGIINPFDDIPAALSHYRTIMDAAFGGDATKMVFGFCLADCGEYNYDQNEIAEISYYVQDEFDCIGGVFLWTIEDDEKGELSRFVASRQSAHSHCSEMTNNTPIKSRNRINSGTSGTTGGK